MQDIVLKIGQKPNAEKYFKKTGQGFQIHSTKSNVQYIFAFFLIVFVGALLAWIYHVLLTESINKEWPKETFFYIQVGIAVIACMVLIASICIASISRISWLDFSFSRVSVISRFLFTGRKTTFERSRVKSVILETRYDPNQEYYPYWNIKLDIFNGKQIPLTMKTFSDGTYSSFQNDNRSVLSKHPGSAWVLSRILDVPLILVTKTYQMSIQSYDDISLTDGEKQQMTIQHIEDEKKRNQDFKSISKRYGILMGSCFLVILGVFLFEFISGHEYPKILLIHTVGALCFVAIALAVIYYFYRKSQNSK